MKAFIKVEQTPPSDDSKKGFIWVLAESALQEGVKSTTRYRKQNSNKKSLKTAHPARQRQLSGAKGGKAAKKSAATAKKMSRPRRTARTDRPSPSLYEGQPDSPSHSQLTGDYEGFQHSPYHGPYYHYTRSSTPLSTISAPRAAFDYGDIMGCTPDSEGPLFYDEPLIDSDGTMLPGHPFTNIDETFSASTTTTFQAS